MKTDPNQPSNKIEFNKLQGFDVLEKLPEERAETSYNEQFYSSLSNMKFLSMTIPDENKLFYHFEQNENASVTTTTGQVLKTYEDLFMENETVKKILRSIKTDITKLFKDYENIDTTIIDELKPEIIQMERRLQNYLVEQKTENFKLIKEIAILEKEKGEIQKQIESCLNRLDRLEMEVGIKDKGNSIQEAALKGANAFNNNSSNMSERFNVDQVQTNKF
jgi:hypothetical protein